jgi:hypothetical protein
MVARRQGRGLAPSPFLTRTGRRRPTMYIGIATTMLIISMVLFLRAFGVI